MKYNVSRLEYAKPVIIHSFNLPINYVVIFIDENTILNVIVLESRLSMVMTHHTPS